MWLIDIRTFELCHFVDGDVPEYVILSHRWADHELTFEEFRKGLWENNPSNQKIERFCRTVLTDFSGLVDWVWVDTVCIDRRSSAELTGSINSMWAYYRDAAECYVYMSDVKAVDESDTGEVTPRDRQLIRTDFQRSAWFTRGWTLQELLAPRGVTFLSTEWVCFGRKGLSKHPSQHLNSIGPFRDGLMDLGPTTSEVTQIPLALLRNMTTIDSFSVAERMSWASRRCTTLVEDEAYCLLGLFGVRMPLMYGERRVAFLRLQQQIIMGNDDQSILAWRLPRLPAGGTPSSAETRRAPFVLAVSPAAFASAGTIKRLPHHPGQRCAITELGLELQTYITSVENEAVPSAPRLHLAPLNCSMQGGYGGSTADTCV